MVSSHTKLEKQLREKKIKTLIATPNDVVEKKQKASVASALPPKASVKISKNSIEMQVEAMTQIFSKPIEEREKSDKERIVQFLRGGVPFLADI